MSEKRPETRGGVPARRGRALTAREAAAYCGVKPSTLAKWRLKGIGPRFSTALGRDAVYHVDSLDEFLWGNGLVRNTVEARHKRDKRRRLPIDA